MTIDPTDITQEQMNLAGMQSQQHERLLYVLSNYFDTDKSEISFQKICDDLLFLSGATFCILNVFEKESDLLKTVSLSHRDDLHPDSTRLFNKTWQEDSFIYKSIEAAKLSVKRNETLLEYGLISPFIVYSGLTRKGFDFGSIVLGIENDKWFNAESSTEYFIRQVEKIIPTLLDTKTEPINYFKHSEIIKKNDTDLVFVIDRRFRIIDTNTNIPTGPGSFSDQRNILSFVPDNLQHSFSKSVCNCFESGKTEYDEVPLHINEQEDIFYAIKFIPIKMDGRIDSMCIVATDTEEQKHLLRDFDVLQNFAKLGWWELHQPGYKLLWSEGLYRILELDPLSVDSSDDLYLQYIHPEDGPYVERTYKRALKDKHEQYEISYRLVMKDGRVKWVTDKCITYFDDYGNQLRSIGIIQDITQLKRAELKLKKINSSYKRLNDQVPGVIFEYQIFENGERRFNSVSEKVVERSGIDAERLNKDGRLIWERIHPDDLEMMKIAFAESARTLKRVNIDYRVFVHHEGDRVSWKRLEASPEKQEDNSRIWYGYISDIDEMKEAQLKILEAKEEAERANKAKTEFLANMSHEIRTPMNAVLGFSELLKGNTKGPRYESYIDGILSGGKNLLSLIDDILDLSKIEAGQMNIQNVQVNIEKLASEFRQMFAQKST